ncbi:carboxy terminal-processing peptidase [Pseudofulvibacter geojedonensis]|uniref:Carboxy terminal-processing peptidase n=1 Tax=Pseudofulvibacter geojedonensis TaxID=1123758 RepID=A0ABW3I3W8_9FLAO
MKKNLKFLVLLFLVAVTSCSFTTKTFDNPDKDKLLIDLITYVLDRGHYNPKDMDDTFSENVFNDFLESIDPLKRYFYKKDIEEFAKYKTKIDDQIKNKEITFFNLVYDRLQQRMEEAEQMSLKLLDTPFDYSKKEDISVDYEKLPYAESKKQMKDRWRKQLKYSTINDYDNEIEADAKKKEDEEGYKGKTKSELEAIARKDTKEFLIDFFDIMDDLERKDWFANYINAIVEEFDPHTFYFAPQDKERFDQNMSGKLEGIGARLQKKRDEVKIVELISGGPAWRGQDLEVGDVIVKVAQEGEKESTAIGGMRLDDAVKLIKGPKGTKVTLTVKKVDGSFEDIVIKRDVVELEETYAKSSLVKKDNRTFGFINLPKFYVDFKDYSDSRNAASDVKKEIIRLKNEGMEGLVIDLRNNGGGSLQTVVDMAGLFIKEGPIVQVKSTGKRKDVLSDTDESILWDGPLVILVNELSASASEILAAALQDYKRAIIIGSDQTFGKGTVQNVYDLNQFMRSSSFGDVGALKVTTQKFYRINGGSTQLEGVKSDVVVVDRYSFIDIGEKDQENPLPWDKIDPASYTAWDGFINYEETIKSSKARMANNNQLKLIEEQAKWIKKQSDEKQLSLNYDDYLIRKKVAKEQGKKYEALDKYVNSLSFSSLPYEKELIKKDSILGEKRSRWHKNLSKDVYVEEAINVLEDLQISNIKKKNKVAVLKD